MMYTLVTGANGFVGRSLISMFPTDKRRAAVRSVSLASQITNSVAVGEIDEHTNWEDALRGVECVVHLAARVHIMVPSINDQLLFQQTNVMGTQRLARAAAAMGVKRFVFLSTVKVNGEMTTDRPFTARDVPHPMDAYGISKWQAEDRLFEIASECGMEAIAIRSPLIYGPEVRANFLRLMDWMYRGVPLPFGAIANQRSMVCVWNLCNLIKVIVDAPSLKSGVLMVSDGVDLSTPELVRRLAEGMGRPARLLPVSATALRLLGLLVGKSAEVARLCDSLTVDISETRHLLNWNPPVAAGEGIYRTARWYLDEVKARGC